MSERLALGQMPIWPTKWALKMKKTMMLMRMQKLRAQRC